MYEKYYGLSARPFQLNPDPSFYFDSTQHRRAMAFVQYGMHQNEGFIVITGEVGAGKTTLVRSLLASLDPNKVVSANLVSTQLDADDTLRLVAAAFGVRTKDLTKADLLLSLEGLLASHTSQGRRCLLIVDEAQNLTARAVEELRMLSNFQLGTHALLQSFLVGQPEFRRILQNPEMHQLRQRVIAACHIGPLDVRETQKYVEHRLTKVGWRGTPKIQDDAFLAIHEASGGVPRRVNLLCDRVLLSGFLAELRVLSAATVREVADEIMGETNTHETQANEGVGNPTPLQHERPVAVGAARSSQPGPREGSTYEVVSPLDMEALRGQLDDITRGMRQFQTSLHRVEQANQETAGLFRRLVDLMRKGLPNRES